MMERRPLGSTGMAVSLLGLGTVKLGRSVGVKYPRPFELPDDAAARRLLERARELGINLLDTAPAYGDSELRLGRLMGRRDDWIVCTKVGEEFEDGRSRFDFSAAHTRASVARSLERLATDHLDVVLIHSDGRDLEILEAGETLDTLFELKREGLVRAVGMSHKTPEGGRRALDLGCDVIMATLNPDYTAELELIAEAGRRGRGVLIKKALASGHAGPESLAFAASRPGVSSVVVGTIDPDHLAANAAAVGHPGAVPRSR